jgi:methylmalonyl-CoA/ethylmalonyl-CoA epimerase
MIELLRPISHPVLAKFLDEHGPGLHHVAFGVRDLPDRIRELKEKGVFVNEPFVAGTGWKIAYFDLAKGGLDILRSQHHGDHLAEVATQS